MGSRKDVASALRTAGWFTAARLVTAVSAAVAGFIAAAELGPAGRGQVAVGLLIGYFGAVVALRGIESSLPAVAAGRTFPDAFGAAAGFLAPGLFSVAALAVCASVGAALSTWFPISGPLAVGVLAIGTALQRAAAAAGAASADMKRQPIVTGTSGVVLVVGAWSLAARGGSSPADWLWLYALASVSGVVVARLPRRSEIGLRSRLSDAAWPSLATTLASFASLRADRLLLSLLAGTEELGLYVVAASAVELSGTPAKALAQALVARWRLSGAPGVGVVVSAGLVISAPIGLTLLILGRWLIPTALGDAYERSVDLLFVLVPAAVVQLTGRGVSARLLSMERHRRVGVSESVGVALGVCVMVASIPALGALGAAVGALAGAATTTTALLWFSRNADAQPTETRAQRP